ncbi:unnamed protein product [Rangifer tarandus platyrhynchus]|uniref:Uncharacterized protein n=1 Tax=Rangifer tarandus platyrhynchus TaxID=3082113 RepID=A0ABN8Y7D5_RANTA|nr:unnamed protein product [Rangifer tarandus platyrhynchus]
MDQACSASASPWALAGAQVWLCIMEPIFGDRITHPFRRTFIIGSPPCAPRVLCDCVSVSSGCVHGTPGAEVSIRKVQGVPSGNQGLSAVAAALSTGISVRGEGGMAGPSRV